jgi:Protein of unknown function (DUF3540)
MSTTTSTAQAPGHAAGSLPVEALVLGIEDDRVRLRAVPGSGGGEMRARVAVLGYTPAEGDRVIAQEVEGGGAFILGVVHASQRACVTAPSGASASVDGDRIAVRDAEGRVVVTLDGATGELCISAEKDLRLAAPSGRVLVEAATEVRLQGASLAVTAAEAALAIGHYELRAERIIERTTDAFRTASGLVETRAKHARMIVSRTLELFGRRTTVASEEDTRIDGKRVLLG